MEAGPKQQQQQSTQSQQQQQQQQQQPQQQQQQQNSSGTGTGQTSSQATSPQSGQAQGQAQGQPNQDAVAVAAATAEAGPVEEGVLLARVHVPELYVSKCLQFPKDQLVWDVKQQCLASLPKVRHTRTHANTHTHTHIQKKTVASPSLPPLANVFRPIFSFSPPV